MKNFKNESPENWHILLDALYFSCPDNSPVIKHIENFLNNIPAELQPLYLKEDWAKNFYPQISNNDKANNCNYSCSKLHANLSQHDLISIARANHLLTWMKGKSNAPKKLKAWLKKNSSLLKEELEAYNKNKEENPNAFANNNNGGNGNNSDDEDNWINQMNKGSENLKQEKTIFSPLDLIRVSNSAQSFFPKCNKYTEPQSLFDNFDNIKRLIKAPT